MKWGSVANKSPSCKHADITLVDKILRSHRQRTGNIILVSDMLCYRKVQSFTRLGVNAEGRRVVVCGRRAPPCPRRRRRRRPLSRRVAPRHLARHPCQSLRRSLSVSLLTHVDTTDSLKRATRVYYRCKVRFSTIL